jgi:hypothetical protein
VYLKTLFDPLLDPSLLFSSLIPPPLPSGFLTSLQLRGCPAHSCEMGCPTVSCTPVCWMGCPATCAGWDALLTRAQPPLPPAPWP